MLMAEIKEAVVDIKFYAFLRINNAYVLSFEDQTN